MSFDDTMRVEIPMPKTYEEFISIKFIVREGIKMKFNLDRKYTIKQKLGSCIEILENGKIVYYEDSDGDSSEYTYDKNRKILTYMDSDGVYEEFVNGICVYYKYKDVVVFDKRVKTLELTLDDIASKYGVDVSKIKIKK